jgi:hypothetical protein
VAWVRSPGGVLSGFQYLTVPLSVLPEVARKAAEDIASLIITAGCLVPGTQRRRRPGWGGLRDRARSLVTAGLSHAHPVRQISRPPSQATARQAHPRTHQAMPEGTRTGRAGRAAIPWPTSAHATSAPPA